MYYTIRVEVWGDYALFTRPEMRIERVSYDVMTPSAARGILEAIYWHPSFKYEIDKIFVLNKIKFANIRRNEITQKISSDKLKKFIKNPKGELYLSASKNITQRAAVVLKDVRYVIDAHMIVNYPRLKTRACPYLKLSLQLAKFKRDCSFVGQTSSGG